MMVRFLLLVFSFFSLAACSLSYKVEEPQVDHIPELVFTDVEYLDYEAGKVSMMMKSSQLEQYRDDSALYGREVSFSTYTQAGELSAQGSSQMISVNTADQQYSLLGDVFIDSIQDDMVVRSQALRWDGVGEQLVSGSSDTLELVRGSRGQASSQQDPSRQNQEAEHTSRIEMAGIGFSASAVSRSFQFSGEVSGTIYTRKKQDVPQ